MYKIRKFKIPTVALAVFAASSAYAASVLAAPIESEHLIHIFQLDYPDAFSNYSTDSFYQNAYGDGVQAYGDLSTGKVGSLAANFEGSINSIVSVYDTLIFDSVANVSFSFMLDGMLASTSPFQQPYGQGRIDIFDVTGLDYWLETSSLFGIPNVGVVSEAMEISVNTISVDMDGVEGYQSDSGAFSISDPLATNGIEHDVNHGLSGTFSVDPSKTYGIRLTANAFSDGPGSVANFFNTGTFGFTDLGGASFSSGSGQFLSAQTASSVPEPSTIVLLCLGLLGLVTRDRFKNRLCVR